MQNIVKTKDGSNTLFDNRFNESLHSENGAYTESKHIFIDAGMNYHAKNEIHILEIGYGTGLNAILTKHFGALAGKTIRYTGIEKYPPTEDTLTQYFDFIPSEIQESADAVISAPWNTFTPLGEQFGIHKIESDFTTYPLPAEVDVVYFDAFSPEKHPEAWSTAMFEKIFACMNEGGILVTYSAKGIVKQALRAVGFEVKRLAGPPGKRHILRATKIAK